jgi:hypothetical protein
LLILDGIRFGYNPPTPVKVKNIIHIAEDRNAIISEELMKNPAPRRPSTQRIGTIRRKGIEK